MAGDIYGRDALTIKFPYTADMAKIKWGGTDLVATNVSLNYAQSIQRRHAIGSNAAIIYATRPIGSLSVARLIVDGAFNFNEAGWYACNNPGTITISLMGPGCGTGANAATGGIHFTLAGCIVTQFSLQMESEGLTIIDNVAIDFMQMFKA